MFIGALLASLAGFVVQSVERGTPVRITPKLLSIFGREALGRVLIIGISPLGWINSSPKKWGEPLPEQAPRVPVLLLPGYGTNWSALWFLCQFLGHRGWTWLWPANHAGRAHSLTAQGEHLGRQIAELKKQLGERDKVIGELTIANRILKKTADESY